MKIGEVITKYREEHGISQRTFARRCGLSNAQVSFLERGYGANGKPFEPKYDTIRKVARAMGTTAEALIAECDDFMLDISDEPESKDDSLILGFMEEMRQKNNLTDDERLLLDMFRTLTAEKQSELLRIAMRMKIDSETR